MRQQFSGGKTILNSATLAGSAILLTLACTSTPAQDHPGSLDEAISGFYAALAAGDLDAVAATYAEDAVMVASGETPSDDQRLEGRMAIRAYFADQLESVDTACSWQALEVLESDILTAVSGVDQCEVTDRASGKSESVSSQWMALYRQQLDGSWETTYEQF